MFLVSSLCPIREKRYIRTCKPCDKESIQAFLFLVNYFERCFHISRQVRAVFPPGFPCVSRPILWYAKIRLHGPSSFYSSSHLCRECVAACRSFIFFSATIFLNDRSEPCRIYFHHTRLCEPFFLFFYKKSPFFIMVYIRKQKERRMLHAACCLMRSFYVPVCRNGKGEGSYGVVPFPRSGTVLSLRG